MRRCSRTAARRSRRRGDRSAGRPRCSSASSSRTTPACTWSRRPATCRALTTRSMHRLAVFALADLEVAGVGRRLDEVALGVDVEQARRLAADLPADEEVRADVDVVLLQVRPVALLDLAQRVADQPRDLEHRRRVPQVELLVARACALVERVERVLRDRQVARRQRDDDALAGPRRRSASSRSGRSGRRRRWCASPTRRSSPRRASWRRNRSSVADVLPKRRSRRSVRRHQEVPVDLVAERRDALEEIHQVLVQARAG